MFVARLSFFEVDLDFEVLGIGCVSCVRCYLDRLLLLSAYFLKASIAA